MITALRKSLNRPVVVGHRGAMSYAPENTIASFQRALELGADVVEFDVHLTADGVPVVIHDTTLNRTTDGQGPVSQMHLAELRALDAGSWFSDDFAGERIPTLDEALAWAHSHLPVAVELKGTPRPVPLLVERVVEALRRHVMLERAIVISFDHPALAQARRFEPSLHSGLLYACRPVDAPALARGVGSEALLPHWSYVVADDVALAHAAGMSVQPWESSSREVISALLAAGVDGVASNRPDVARRIVERRRVS